MTTRIHDISSLVDLETCQRVLEVLSLIHFFLFWPTKNGKPLKDIVRYVDYASDKVALDLFSAQTIKSIMGLNSGDIGNSAVIVVSLAMTRMRSFAVNSRTATWKIRSIFIWSGLLWYTSFHTQGSTFLTNQRNIALESVALLFLILRSDVPNIRRATSEPNEHFYGLLRQLLREFKVDEMVHLANKLMLKVNAIFKGNLVLRSDVPNIRRATSEPKEHFYGLLRQLLCEFKVHLVNKLMLKVHAMFKGNIVPRRSPGASKGYLSTFPEWLKRMKDGR